MHSTSNQVISRSSPQSCLVRDYDRLIFYKMASSTGSTFHFLLGGEPGAAAGFPAGSSALTSTHEAADSEAETILLPALGLLKNPPLPVFTFEPQAPVADVSGIPIPASEMSAATTEVYASGQALGSHDLSALEHDEFAR